MLFKSSIQFLVRTDSSIMSQNTILSSRMSMCLSPLTFLSLHSQFICFCFTSFYRFVPSLHLFASRNNSASQADYTRSPKSPSIGPPGVPFKPVPPPKPKNYRPPIQSGQMHSGNWENGVSIQNDDIITYQTHKITLHQEPTTPRSPNGFFYPSTPSHYHHSSSQSAPPPPNPMNHHGQHMSNYNQYASGNGTHYGANQSQHYGGMNGNHSYGGQYHHRSPPVLGKR